MYKELLMVSGRSGVGKTLLIDLLIKLHPNYYERPVSYTSRPRRENEGDREYKFSTESEMFSMKSNNAFVNFDYNYGNFYAMTRRSIEEILENGKAPIKEIHPKNFGAIKAVYHDAVTILIINDDDVFDRGDKRENDKEYYENIREELFDITYFNDRSIPPLKCAEYLHQKIQIFLKYRDQFPAQSGIDDINKHGYDLIAHEFTEKKRITTHNFHTLSIRFIQDAIKSYVVQNMRVLEVGPGRGWLRNSFLWPDVKYSVLDISKEMINYEEAQKEVAECIVSSISSNLLRSETYQVVFSSLGDPYFYPLALFEIYRIIDNGGYFIFTLPAADWAQNLREKNINKTTFISLTGEKAESYSFSINEAEIAELLQACGFEVLKLYSISALELFQNRETISPAIKEAIFNKKCTPEQLDVITVGVCRKGYVND